MREILGKDGDSRLRDAICGHVDWLRKFQVCIEKGALDRSAHDISCHNKCDFGKWLETLAVDPSDPTLQKFGIIDGLHRRFHSQAGDIAHKIEAGLQQEAQEAFSSKSFRRMTHSLVLNLHDWRQDFKASMTPGDSL
ncbi:CZB domain-containing protein [Celeribacter neptunius]|uniref:Chemoreceptor zinc-binding domain-containing protein n=1 Tax=Celeribacter neptunius TaxID=588602 RepID=A0A1I3WGV1_9RHOB|nr:CZB domain-containing protein [Celeribacter neptunius]SFK06620.1 Chemoreceptor zinc-binding domain-containing protein [Celeribacter neptunius]